MGGKGRGKEGREGKGKGNEEGKGEEGKGGEKDPHECGLATGLIPPPKKVKKIKVYLFYCSPFAILLEYLVKIGSVVLEI